MIQMFVTTKFCNLAVVVKLIHSNPIPINGKFTNPVLEVGMTKPNMNQNTMASTINDSPLGFEVS